MSGESVRQLEHDVEAARSRLAEDLSTLRSPSTLSEFTSELKREAEDAKDALIESAKSSVRSQGQAFVDNLKGRAAANPLAALAIGAGLGWRFLHRPPIATTLVAAGLFSLFRTAPLKPNGNSQMDHLAQAKERLKQQGSAIAGQVGELASEAVQTVRERAGELAGALKDQMSNPNPEREQTPGGFAEQASALAYETSSAVGDVLDDPEIRDKVLLGLAGMAIAAAVGIAYQRRDFEDSGRGS